MESKISTLTIEKTNILIRGAWNESILSDPAWLLENCPSVKKMLIGGQKEAIVEFQIVPQKIRLNFGAAKIIPSREALVIEPSLINENIFSLISQVAREIIEKLPHTPIQVIGHNFTFILDETEELLLNPTEFDQSVVASVSNVIGEKIKSEAGAHRTSLAIDKGYTLNITEEYDDQKKVIAFNFHYEVQNKKIVKFLSCFEENYRLAKTMSQKLAKCGNS